MSKSTAMKLALQVVNFIPKMFLDMYMCICISVYIRIHCFNRFSTIHNDAFCLACFSCDVTGQACIRVSNRLHACSERAANCFRFADSLRFLSVFYNRGT